MAEISEVERVLERLHKAPRTDVWRNDAYQIIKDDIEFQSDLARAGREESVRLIYAYCYAAAQWANELGTPAQCLDIRNLIVQKSIFMIGLLRHAESVDDEDWFIDLSRRLRSLAENIDCSR